MFHTPFRPCSLYIFLRQKSKLLFGLFGVNSNALGRGSLLRLLVMLHPRSSPDCYTPTLVVAVEVRLLMVVEEGHLGQMGVAAELASIAARMSSGQH